MGGAGQQVATRTGLPIRPLPLDENTSVIVLDAVDGQLVLTLSYFVFPLSCWRGKANGLTAQALTGLALSPESRNARLTTSANTIFIGIMMPLKASTGTVTSVPAK